MSPHGDLTAKAGRKLREKLKDQYEVYFDHGERNESGKIYVSIIVKTHHKSKYEILRSLRSLRMTN